MKRINILSVICLGLALMLSACAKEPAEYEGIEGKWKCTKVFNDGEITELSFFTKAPTFECDDGTNCVLTTPSGAHNAIITEEEGCYIIDFDDTDVNLIAEFEGETLKMTIEDHDDGYYFERK